MPFNPFNSRNLTDRQQLLLSRNELRGFCREIVEPDFDEHHRNRVSLYYFPPLLDGLLHKDPYLVRLAELITPPFRWHKPYWWELTGLPGIQLISHPLNLPNYHNLKERLHLFVDRDVKVKPMPDGDTSVWVPTVLRPNPQAHGDRVPVKVPEILIHRVQNEAQLPQSTDDDFAFLAQAVLLEKDVPSGTPGSARKLIVIKEPDQQGGVLLVFYRIDTIPIRQTSLPHDPGIPVRTVRAERSIIAMVQLTFAQAENEGAFYYRIADRPRNGRYRVDIVVSTQNVRVTIFHPRLLRIATPSRGCYLGAEADHLPDFDYFDIRLAWKPRPQVPRPDFHGTVRTENWRDAARGPYKRRFKVCRVQGFDLSTLGFDIAIGFIPGVGDLVEVGEFIYASVTGTDKWGDRVGAYDLFLMGLGAIVPFLTAAAVRRFSRYARSRLLLEQANEKLKQNLQLDDRGLARFLNELPGYLDRQRPLLVEKIRNRKSVNASDLPELGEALVNLREASRIVRLTGIRDNIVAALPIPPIP